MIFVIVDIGCLECGESSEILDVVKDDKVQAIANLQGLAVKYKVKHAQDEQFSYFDHGEHSVEILEWEPKCPKIVRSM